MRQFLSALTDRLEEKDRRIRLLCYFCPVSLLTGLAGITYFVLFTYPTGTLGIYIGLKLVRFYKQSPDHGKFALLVTGFLTFLNTIPFLFTLFLIVLGVLSRFYPWIA